MKLIFQTLIFLLFANYSFSQTIIFNQLEELPIGRSAIHSATDGENIYIVNGFTTQIPYSPDVLQYNVATDMWTTISTSTVEKRFANVSILDGKLYIINGELFNGEINTNVEVIDLSNNALSYSTPHPNPGRAAGVAEWEGKIYSFGGLSSTNVYSNKLYSFDPTTEQWTNHADMLVATETKGEIIDGKLYVFGGFNGSALNRIDRYDIATDTWEMIGTMPNTVSANATTVIGNTIWLVGDYTNLSSLAYFDTSDESFHLLNTNMVNRRHGAAEGIDFRLYAIGGNSTSNISSSTTNVEVGDIPTSTEKVLLDFGIQVYPNPTSEVLFFEKEINQIQIFDANGKLVKTFSEKKEKINVSELQSGNYLLIGESDGKRYSASWVKM